MRRLLTTVPTNFSWSGTLYRLIAGTRNTVFIIYIDNNLTVVYKFIVFVDCDDDDALPPGGEESVFVLFTAGKEVVL